MSEELNEGAAGAKPNAENEVASPSTTAVINYLTGGDLPLAKRIPTLDDVPETPAPAAPAQPEPAPAPLSTAVPDFLPEVEEVPQPDATVVAPAVPVVSSVPEGYSGAAPSIAPVERPVAAAPKRAAHFATPVADEPDDDEPSNDGFASLDVIGQNAWEEPAPKKGILKKVAIGLAAAAVVAAAYVGGAFYFASHFLPNTTIEGRDVSLQSTSDLEAMLKREIAGYSTHVTGDGIDLTITAADVDLQVNSERYVEEAKEQQNQWAWPLLMLQGSHQLSVDEGASINETKLNELLKGPFEAVNAAAEKSQDATIAYSKEDGAYRVVPEVYGTEIDVELATEAVSAGLLSLSPEVKLGNEEVVQPQVKSDNDHLNQAVNEANEIVTLEIPLTLGGHEAYVIGPELISQWVTLDDDLNAKVDAEKVDAWTHVEMSALMDTVGTERTYKRPDGHTVTVSGGTYGWITDSAATTPLIVDALENHKSDPIAVPCKQEAASFDGIGKADWGDTWIEVDLAAQYAWYYVDGECVWETAIVSGTPDGEHDTPSGVYFINENKQMNITLVGFDEDKDGEPDYKTDVTYWMPFINVNIGLHDAWWRYEFGGDIYTWYGSHGCINLPTDAARELYDMADVGTVVITHW